jgi:transposase
MNSIKILGIDLAKTIFHIYGIDSQGRCVVSKRMSRGKLAEYLATLPRCIVAMEACGSSHYWGRRFREFGHEVKLISPQFVKPYVKTNKNDEKDAEAIAEAASRPTMRFVSIKSVEQQEIQSVHRVRERLVRDRTALGNQIRGLLQEYGIIFKEGLHHLRRELPQLLSMEDSGLGVRTCTLIQDILSELLRLDERIECYDQIIKTTSRDTELCRRLEGIPGIGPITSTALVASVGDARVFRNGREFAAYLGLVPKQRSSGGKSVLLGISKRGDGYLRKLLVHGARSVVSHNDRRSDKNKRSRWIGSLEERRGMNRTSVALANKNARIAWALMVSGEQYRQ